jgi:hypothetical protein
MQLIFFIMCMLYGVYGLLPEYKPNVPMGTDQQFFPDILTIDN